MLRWLSVFGAVALVAAGVVFFVYKGPPSPFFRGPTVEVDKPQAPQVGEKNAAANQLPAVAPAASPWSGEIGVTPRVVIPGARLTAISTPQVPSMQDGQLLFLGTEIKVKPGEQGPPGSFKQEMSYLVMEVPQGESGPQDNWVPIKGKWYRPLSKGEDPRPTKLQIHRADKWFMPVDEGTQVKKGDLLAMIDPVLAVDELSIKVAKLDAADAERIASQKIKDFEWEHLQRVTELLAKGAATKEEVSEARAGYERYVQDTISKGEAVKVAAKELRQAETALELHTIRSKIDGQVKQIIKHEGEAVKRLDQAVLEMQDHSKLRIRARVDLQDLYNLPDPRNPKDTRVVYVEATRLVPPVPQGILTGHFDAVTGVAVSKDKQIVSVSEDRTMRIWQKDLAARKSREFKHPAAVRAVACTPATADKNLCLTGAADGIARLYELSAEDVRQVRQLAGGHKEAINSVAFSPDGRWAVTGGDDRAICLWDLEGYGSPRRFNADWGHRHGVTSVAFLAIGPEKKLSVVSAGRDSALIVWPLGADGAPEKALRFDHRGGEITTLGVNPNGSQLLFDQGKDLNVVSSENGSLVGRMSATGGANFSKLALFSPDGNLVLASTGPGRLGLWRAPTTETRGYEFEQLIWTSSRDEQAATNCGAFAPDGSFLVTGTQNRNVIVWPMPSKEDVERPLTAKIINLDPEVTSGQVRVTAELDKPPSYLLPGKEVTLVVYPEKQ